MGEIDYLMTKQKLREAEAQLKAALDLLERADCPNQCINGRIKFSPMETDYLRGPNKKCPWCAERKQLLGERG